MFFPEKIRSIGPNYKVLEIGPGALPYERADVFLELRYSDEETSIAQRGNVKTAPKLQKPVVFYDGGRFPFKDKEFDYVVCSHVIEHVPDPVSFCSELFRIAGKGYIEYPLATYEYLYNYDVHLHLLKRQKDGRLAFLPKSKTRLSEFNLFQNLNRKMHDAGANAHLLAFEHLFFEGFEWSDSFKVFEVSDLSQLLPEFSPSIVKEEGSLRHFKNSAREFLKAIKLR
ncbi:MAG: methyltransferase domain-containing protein [Bdellovibrionia bacterium]